MEKSFTRNTITRYEEIRNILTSGTTGLSSADYQFYLRYCKKHGIAHEKVSVVKKPVRSAHYASQKERYDDVMRRLSMGRGIGAIDYRFLKRYCNERTPQCVPCQAGSPYRGTPAEPQEHVGSQLEGR